MSRISDNLLSYAIIILATNATQHEKHRSFRGVELQIWTTIAADAADTNMIAADTDATYISAGADVIAADTDANTIRADTNAAISADTDATNIRSDRIRITADANRTTKSFV